MAQSLKVMISSRCDSKIPFSEGEVSLTDLRRELKTLIESKSLFDEKPLFSVWINDEDAAAAAADEASWEHCLRQAEESEIFVCLYNGEAGWSATAGGIGICHAELERALCMGRLKVVLIEIPEPNENVGELSKREMSTFKSLYTHRDYFEEAQLVQKQKPFVG